jgi:hypothetical protein
VELSTSYGTPALKVNGKLITRVHSPGVLVLMCPLHLKAHLLEAAPEMFFETDHYRGWSALLARVEAIDDDSLAARLEATWRERAPKRLVREVDEAARQSPSG